MRRLLLALPLALLPRLAQAEAPTRVWVFFTDHGRSDVELDVELARREAELGPRTLARRAKVRDDALVDARDLLPSDAYVDAVVRRGAELRVASRWLNAISVEADAATQRAIAELPFVRGLHPVARSQAPELEFSPLPAAANPDDYGASWDQLELIGVPDLHDCGLTGAGVIMAVQDTGFLLDHQAYADVDVIAMHDFVAGDDQVGPEPGDAPEQHVHGTWVLATMVGNDPGAFRGVAPGVSLILSKTENQPVEEPAEEDLYVAGLEWIESMGADIFSGSLIYKSWYAPEDFDGASAVTTLAIEAAVGNGLIVFTSMGNDGPNPSTLGAPSDAAGAITVGAVDALGQLAPFSSRGPTADGRIKPDVVAPGWNVVSIDPATTDAYVMGNGTSFSTPIAAGVGALLLEANPDLTPAQMAELFRSTASQAAAPDNDMGYGVVDALAAVGLYCTCIDADGDAHYDAACGGDDCDDAQASSHPGAPEQCNGIDDDCDLSVPSDELDQDGDDHLACDDDCDDTDPAVHPLAPELCDNAIDDDCDQLVDALDPDCAMGSEESDAGSGGSGGESTSENTSDEVGAGLDDARGCGCSSPTRSPGVSLLGLLLLGLVRRRANHRGRGW